MKEGYNFFFGEVIIGNHNFTNGRKVISDSNDIINCLISLAITNFS